MRYVTSVEQIGIEKGILQGMQQGLLQGLTQGRAEGEAYALRRLLQKRFGPLPEDALTRLHTASVDELEHWLDRALDADSLAEVFSQ